MMKTIKVSEKGQISIPNEIRDKAGISKGDELVITLVGNKMLIEKSQKVENKIKDDFKDILRFSEGSLKSVWDNKGDEIWSQYLK